MPGVLEWERCELGTRYMLGRGEVKAPDLQQAPGGAKLVVLGSRAASGVDIGGILLCRRNEHCRVLDMVSQLRGRKRMAAGESNGPYSEYYGTHRRVMILALLSPLPFQ